MEAKLDKIFNIFSERDNEKLFELCVRQIVEIYKDSPSSIYYLLKKAMRLLFSTTKDSYLQLKHRQVAAGIIEKTYRSYTERLQKFLHTDLKSGDDIDILSLFHMEKISKDDKSPEEDRDACYWDDSKIDFKIDCIQSAATASNPSQPQSNPMEIEEEPSNKKKGKQPKGKKAKQEQQEKQQQQQQQPQTQQEQNFPPKASARFVRSIDEIKLRTHVKVTDVDFNHLLLHEEPLYAREKGFFDVQLQGQRESKELEDQILSRMGLGTELNVRNLQCIMNTVGDNSSRSMQNDQDLIAGVIDDDDFGDSQSTAATTVKGKKNNPATTTTTKSGKNANNNNTTANKKQMNQQQDGEESEPRKKFKATEDPTQQIDVENDLNMRECIGLRLFVPFNNIYHQCLKNLLSRTWEIRHYSAMVLKGFLKEKVEFLDFQHRMYMKDIDPALLEEDKQQELFQLILGTLQKQLRVFLSIDRNLNDKVENYLSRSLVILVMDQFSDHSDKKIDIMIRRVACDMITLILKNNQLVTHEYRVQILQLVKQFLNRSIQQRGQRLITLTSLVLINSLLTEREDLREEIFELYRSSYTTILNEDQDEDIIMYFCDNFLIYVGEKKWINREKKFLSSIISKLWKYVDMFDSISYNIKTILSLLKQFYLLGFMVKTDFTANHIVKLFKNFFHWEEEVRLETYNILADGMQQLERHASNRRIIELLLDLIARGFVVEKHTTNFDALIQLWLLAAPHVETSSLRRPLALIFEVATSCSSCDKIITKLQNSIDQADCTDFSLNPHYSFFIKSLSSFAHFDNTTMRLQRMVQALVKISTQNEEYIKEQCLQFKALSTAPNYHQNMLFVLTFVSSLVAQKTQPTSKISEYFSAEELLKFMSIEPKDIQIESVSTVDQTIQDYLQAVDSITNSEIEIKRYRLIQSILSHLTFTDICEKRKNYEALQTKSSQLSNEIQNHTEIGYKLIQSMDNIVMQVNLFNDKCDDYILVIKISAIYLFIQMLISKNEPLNNLNLICKPLPLYIQSEKFAETSFLASKIIFDLVAHIPKFETAQKLLKNILSKLSFHKKFTKYGISEHEKQTDVIRYSAKSATFNQFITDFLDFHGHFNQLQFLQTSFITQMRSFSEILSDHKWLRQQERLECKPTNWIDLEIEIRNIYKLLDSLMDLRLFSFLQELIPLLFSLASFLHSQAIFPTDETYTKLEQPRRAKISKVTRKILRNIIIRSVKGNFRSTASLWKNHASWIQNTVLSSFLSLLKVQNTIAFELLTQILEENPKDIIDFSGIYVLEVVKCLTSPNPKIKDLAFSNLGKIITSVFLQSKSKSATEHLNADLQKRMATGNQFIMDFQNNSHFDYQLVVTPRVTLREYQMEGVRWLGFLSKYNLNGALCDDMGLGKTLQVLVVLQNEIKKDLDENKPNTMSLIIAPSSIVDHWYFEIDRYLDLSIIKPMVVTSRSFIEDFQKHKENCRVMIASYNTVQRNEEFFQNIQYKFCILDEGHLIKNTKTKVSEAVRSLQAKHKFLLSGTPIQNNLQELWSIFDFLMPGYLGSSENFRNHFSKLFHTNILNFSEEQILFSEEQNKVLQNLHKKVMPFILRRDKKLVLKELPPKIIQDYNCDMTDLQLQLYNDLETNQIGKCELDLKEQALRLQATEISGVQLDSEKQNRLQESVLKMLSQMIAIVNHPSQCKRIKNSPKEFKDYESYTASGKFVALKQLLTDLGFEEKESIQSEEQKFLTTNRNKVLIFSRFKETLELICEYLLNKEFSHIKYLKLDGKVQVSKRYAIINKFNEDSECKIMLLTTSVGGLGLNLTSANVVIMFDHNFNPMNDLQAIDRAHRIGQKNTLNVYRMVMKDTLEERIMGIQRFKINIANAIINLDNSSIKNLKDSNLITLFDKMVEENGYNVRKEVQDEMALAQTKYNPYKKIEAEFDLWVTDDINQEY